MKGDEDHIELGRQHAAEGEPRYKYRDKRLQELYDEGYNSYKDWLAEPFQLREAYCLACGGSPRPGHKYCGRCLA